MGSLLNKVVVLSTHFNRAGQVESLARFVYGGYPSNPSPLLFPNILYAESKG